MRNLIFLAALATTTCAEVGVTEVGVPDVVVTALNDGSMELRYSAPMDQWREAAASFEIELRSRCADGHEKLWRTLDFNDGNSEHILEARCL